MLGRFTTGVTVLTCLGPAGELVGMTANSLASVSLAPPLLLLSIDRAADAHGALVQAPRFIVNILAAPQEGLSRRFAESGADRFNGVGYHLAAGGEPILNGALAHIECDHDATHPGGDHTILIGRVTGGATADGAPLLYYRGGYTGLGPG
ncbi:MAG: flavin reductase family protein [Gemmatimonadales bacterium]